MYGNMQHNKQLKEKRYNKDVNNQKHRKQSQSLGEKRLWCGWGKETIG